MIEKKLVHNPDDYSHGDRPPSSAALLHLLPWATEHNDVATDKLKDECRQMYFTCTLLVHMEG